MRVPRKSPLATGLFLVVLSLVSLAGVGLGQTPDRAAGDLGTVLLFSDVHLNPFADPALVKTLAATEAAGWEAVLAASSAGGFADYGQDANNALFLSALNDMADKAPHPDLILFPGDLLAHRFIPTYAALTGDDTQAGATAFILKTAAYFALEVKKRFPDTPVYVAIGNNDSTLGDYAVAPGEAYLTGTAEVLARTLIPDAAGREAFLATYPRSGHYALKTAGAGNLKLIVANDIYWSKRYADPAPGQAEAAWLDQALAEAKGENVWVMAHIPPGNDAYASARKSEQEQRPVYESSLTDEGNAAFTRLLTANASAIKASFAGHIHRDDFRLLYADGDPGTPVGLMRIAPAISPITGNNPGYQVLTFDRGSGVLLDQTTYYVDLKAKIPFWAKEYTFSQAYGRTLDSPAAWQAVYADLWSDPAKRRAYVTYYAVGAEPRQGITAANFPIYWLSIGHTAPAAFDAKGLPPRTLN